MGRQAGEFVGQAGREVQGKGEREGSMGRQAAGIIRKAGGKVLLSGKAGEGVLLSGRAGKRVQ